MKNPLPPDLIGLIPLLVGVAQVEYDAWQQNEHGFDEELAWGGVCDKISEEVGGVFAEHGFDVMEGGQDGDDHAFCIVTKDGRCFQVDIPSHLYEFGSGYIWRKKPGVIFAPEHVEIVELNYKDVHG